MFHNIKPSEKRMIREGAKPSRKPAPDLALAWLDADQRSSNVMATARMLLSAEQALRQVLPPAMATVCKVARIDRQRITLAVPSAAYAAKLRQLGPRIVQALESAGWNLIGVDVRVQAGLHANRTNPPLREGEPLGDAGLDAFEALRQHLQPGPLADAVGRLLKHHGRRG